MGRRRWPATRRRRRPVDRGRDLRGDARADRDAPGGRRPRRPRQVRQAVRPARAGARPKLRALRVRAPRRVARGQGPPPDARVRRRVGREAPGDKPRRRRRRPGRLRRESLRPGSDAGRHSCVHRRDETEGVLGAYDVVAIEGVSPRDGFEPGHETDGEDDVSDRHRTAINPLANGVDLRDSRCSHRQLCALAAESVSTRLSTHPTPASPTAFGGPLPERARAMIPLVRAMLPGDATTDASILTARASDDHRRQAQVTARMEKRFGTGAFARRCSRACHHPGGGGAEGVGVGVGGDCGWRPRGMSRRAGGAIGSGGGRRRREGSAAAGRAATPSSAQPRRRPDALRRRGRGCGG